MAGVVDENGLGWCGCTSTRYDFSLNRSENNAAAADGPRSGLKIRRDDDTYLIHPYKIRSANQHGNQVIVGLNHVQPQHVFEDPLRSRSFKHLVPSQGRSHLPVVQSRQNNPA